MTLSDLINGFKEVWPGFKYATIDSVEKVTMKDLNELLTAFGSVKKIKNDHKPITILTRRQIATIINHALNPFSWPVDWQGHF
jgi:hypothetical protein